MRENPKDTIVDPLQMYRGESARRFVKSEENPLYWANAKIIEKEILERLNVVHRPWHYAELAAGAHTDAYPQFFAALLQDSESHVDWVDSSPDMIELAQEYLLSSVPAADSERAQPLIHFIEADIFEYLSRLEEDSLDIATLKNAFDYIEDLEQLFSLLFQKLKPGGCMIAGLSSSRIRGIQTAQTPHAQCSIINPNDEIIEIDPQEPHKLQTGERIRVQFFERGTTTLMKGVETILFFHSQEEIEEIAKRSGFKFELNYRTQEDGTGKNLEIPVLVLTKPLRTSGVVTEVRKEVDQL